MSNSRPITITDLPHPLGATRESAIDTVRGYLEGLSNRGPIFPSFTVLPGIPEEIAAGRLTIDLEARPDTSLRDAVMGQLVDRFSRDMEDAILYGFNLPSRMFAATDQLAWPETGESEDISFPVQPADFGVLDQLANLGQPVPEPVMIRSAEQARGMFAGTVTGRFSARNPSIGSRPSRGARNFHIQADAAARLYGYDVEYQPVEMTEEQAARVFVRQGDEVSVIIPGTTNRQTRRRMRHKP